ncbi:MAG: hypothetical protein RMH84_04135 [Sulfolobales archaeon]|nr:hypothetical protein [Sulfolobales archaeon]MCX8208176.1 hypothetical protein [Sulfolobales archaeon]MDW8010764.1 hypothetical protein [Sulfolobales archaeon]
MLSISANSYSRDHVVRVCREKCAEIGFSGKAFQECVELCVKSYAES